MSLKIKDGKGCLKVTGKMDIMNFLIFILGIITANFELYNIVKINNILDIKFIIFDIILNLIIIYFGVSSFLNRLKIKKLNYDIQSLNERNRGLIELNDNIRGFKHDFNNIIQAIDGYILLGDMQALKKYFSKLLDECNHLKNLEILTSNKITNPAIYGVLLNKYRIAEEKKINMTIDILMDFNEVSEKSYCLSRILGILLDNAIEATLDAEEKNINIQFLQEVNGNKRIVIENTYNNKEVDTTRIFEKNFTTKIGKGNSGLGLWKVRSMLDKESSINLMTSKDNKMFKQQLNIYV